MFWQVEGVPSVPSVPDFQSIPGVPSVPCVPCFSNDPVFSLKLVAYRLVHTDEPYINLHLFHLQ